MSKIFIISGNHNEFLNYRKKLLFTYLQDIVYVSSIEVLKGYKEPHGKFIGTWYRRRDIPDIVQQLQIAGSIDQKQSEKIKHEYDRLLFI